jgi:hypothetical protein
MRFVIYASYKTCVVFCFLSFTQNCIAQQKELIWIGEGGFFLQWNTLLSFLYNQFSMFAYDLYDTVRSILLESANETDCGSYSINKLVCK